MAKDIGNVFETDALAKHIRSCRMSKQVRGTTRRMNVGPRQSAPDNF
jgi:hypothetical protein